MGEWVSVHRVTKSNDTMNMITYKFKLLAFPLNIFSLYLTVQQCARCVPIVNVSEYNCVIHTTPTINLHYTVLIMLCKKNSV